MLKSGDSRTSTAIVVSDGGTLPDVFRDHLGAHCQEIITVANGEEALSATLRSRPDLVLVNGVGNDLWVRQAIAASEYVKSDSYSGIIPLIAFAPRDLAGRFLEAGADEVLHDGLARDEMRVRLAAALVRSARDTDVHPSTRLPGARRIESELAGRIAGSDQFAVCYADLDHFKEFNDRYGWHNGDKVIRILARILRDVVRGLCGRDGFVGHIGGDDFLYVVPLERMQVVCDEVIQVFEELIPLQYSEQDRRAGYFFGKDRRGQLHRVPLMTLSIGVATNQRRRYRVPAEVSELASEMKSYAKTLDGSVWAMDRRSDDDGAPALARTAAVESISALGH